MESVRIWLNRNYATSVHLLDLLRHNPDGTPVVLFGSHVDDDSPMLTGCDYRLQEPSPDDPHYVDTMLHLCARHHIDVLLPVAGQYQIAARAAEFEAIGTALICPPAWSVDLLDDKAATYRSLGSHHLAPPWRLITTAAEFDAAVTDLDVHWTPARPLIVKPASGVGAEGVRFVKRDEPDLASLLGPVNPLVGVESMRRALAAARTVPPLLVMPYLDGPETSVDVLAAKGATLAAVPRTKIGRKRVLGGDPALPGLAAEMVRRFDLDGLVNVQFRSFRGRPALLEINTRPSGGLFQTALAEVNLPWAAVRVALGRHPGVLRPRLGAEFVTVTSMIALTDPVPTLRPAAPVSRTPVGAPLGAPLPAARSSLVSAGQGD